MKIKRLGPFGNLHILRVIKFILSQNCGPISSWENFWATGLWTLVRTL